MREFVCMCVQVTMGRREMGEGEEVVGLAAGPQVEMMEKILEVSGERKVKEGVSEREGERKRRWREVWREGKG